MITKKFTIEDGLNQVQIADSSVPLSGITSNGNHSGTSSDFGTFVNLVCTLTVGSGFVMPTVLSLGGWTALAYIPLFGLLCYYIGQTLIRLIYIVPGKRIDDIGQIAREGFGERAFWALRVLMHVALIIAVAFYAVLFYNNVLVILGAFDVDGAELMTTPIWMLIIVACIAAPYLVIRNMADTVYTSTLGLVSIIALTALVLGNGVVPEAEIKHDAFVAAEIPRCLSLVGLGFGGNIVFPHLEGSMKNPSHWRPVFGLSVLFSTACYILIGSFAYTKFGTSVTDTLIDMYPENGWTLAVSIITTMHLYVASLILLSTFSAEWEPLLIPASIPPGAKTFLTSRTIRVILVTLIWLLASFLPKFSAIGAVLGSFITVLLIYFIPNLFQLKMNLKTGVIEKVLNWFLLIAGTGFGLYCLGLSIWDASQI